MSIHDFLGKDEYSRRGFVGMAARRLFGLAAAPTLLQMAADGSGEEPIRLGPATARNVIYLFMRGGMSHVDTFDPKPGKKTQGPVDVIPTKADGILLTQYLPNLAHQMDKVAVINSLSSTQGAHAQGQYFMRTGYLLRGTISHPSTGAWVNRMAGKINATLPGHVVVGGGSDMPTAGFFPPQFLPLPIGNPAAGLQHSKLPKGVDEPTFNRRLNILQRMNQAFESRYDQKAVKAYSEMYDDAVRLMRSSDLAAFDVSKEPENLRAAYGNNGFGQGCLLARRLVEHGVRYVEVVSNGWDTHNQNFDALEDKCPELDRGLSALLADLQSRGLLDETLVVVATEFGRTPDIVASNNGRNHYPKAFSGLLAGGGIKGGFRYGKTDAEGREVVEGQVKVQDFIATIATAVGLPLQHKLHSPSGRPFMVADKGKPVLELFGVTRLLAGLLLWTSAQAQGPVEFSADVLPILADRCFTCHRAEHKTRSGRLRKPKGGLVLDVKAGILAGGEGGPVLELGKPEQSPIYTRTVLPADHDDRMPGRGEPLTKEQTDVLRRWIQEGAPFGDWVGEAAAASMEPAAVVPPSVPDAAAEPPPVLRPDPFAALAEGLSPAPASAMQRASSQGKLAISRLSAESPLLRVDVAGNQDDVGDAEIEDLRAVQGNVAVVSLAFSKVTYQACKTLARFPRLVRLDLRNTTIGDRGLALLAESASLQVVNLFGTAVSDRSVSHLLKMSALKTVYVWQTQITAAGLSRLRQDPRELEIVAAPRWPKAEETDSQQGRGRRRR